MSSDFSSLKVLLTGATGFIGSKLVKRLASLGCEVAILVRKSSSLALLENSVDSIEIYESNGSTESVLSAVGAAQPDVVVHLASQFIAEHQSDDIESLVASNLLFSTQIVEAIKVNEVKYFVNTGTSWEHFNNSEYDPVCLYAATKHAFESVLQYYIQSSNLRAITLKLFDTYGPGDPRPKLIPLLQKLTFSNERVAMSAGMQKIDLVHVDDVTSAFLTAIERVQSLEPHRSEIYSVSSLNPLSLRELVQLYSEACGVNLNIAWGAREYRAREVMTPWENGQNIPGWAPKVGLLQGLRRLTD